VESVLGPTVLVGDRSWGHRASSVVEVRDGRGVSWFVKCLHDRDRYAAEAAAYRWWVPALGDRAPTLRAADDASQTLVLSSVGATPFPDEAADEVGEAEIHRQAGELLRRFHGGQPPAEWADFPAVKLEEFDRWSGRARGLLTVGELDFTRGLVRSLSDLGNQVSVPCNLDYGPRNWVVTAGRVQVIDFEWAARDVWVNDLARLYFGDWQERPDLQTAFLEGYGRRIDADDRALLISCGALRAVWLTVRAHDYGEKQLEEGSRQLLRRLMAARLSER